MSDRLFVPIKPLIVLGVGVAVGFTVITTPAWCGEIDNAPEPDPPIVAEMADFAKTPGLFELVKALPLFAQLSGTEKEATTTVVDMPHAPVWPEGALTLEALVKALRQRNVNLQSGRLSKDIAEASILRAQGAFDTQLSASISRVHTEEPNNIEEKTTRYTSVYESDSTDVSLLLSRTFETGVKVTAELSQSQLMTSTMRVLDATEPDNHRVDYSLSLNQPLLKGAGKSVTTIPIQVAKIGQDVAAFTYEDTESVTIAQVAMIYYDLLLAQRKVVAFEEKIAMGKKMLTMANKLRKEGRLADADVWEVENALTRFESALSEAHQTQREKSNTLRTQVQFALDGNDGMLQVDETLMEDFPQVPAFKESLDVALNQRSDLKAKHLERAQKEKQLSYAKNQALPQVDFQAKYGRSGLAYNRWNAYGESNGIDPSWTVGLSANLNLEGNREARADVLTARIRLDEAKLAIKGLEVSIANDIQTTLKALGHTKARWQKSLTVAEREAKRAKMEMNRFNAGRSDMRAVLRQQERVIDAKSLVTEQQVATMKAQTMFQAAQGALAELYR
ncbi:TolC family protein [Magnetococcus sp. PR-3]|uniref:TolC family protein n=1 Tax=Magnetococcus sp. PR-3 TaxID=3120355 RepID=UPI002FCE3F8B